MIEYMTAVSGTHEKDISGVVDLAVRADAVGVIGSSVPTGTADRWAGIACRAP